MFDDTSPKLEFKGASKYLTKETNILDRGFQMNATLGKITKIGNEKVSLNIILNAYYFDAKSRK